MYKLNDKRLIVSDGKEIKTLLNLLSYAVNESAFL